MNKFVGFFFFQIIGYRWDGAISRNIDNGTATFHRGDENKSWNYRLSMKRVAMDSRVFILHAIQYAKAVRFFLRSPATGIAINSSHFLQGDITLMSITVPRRVLSTKRSPSWRRMSNLAFHHYPYIYTATLSRFNVASRLLVISLFLYATKSRLILPE